MVINMSVVFYVLISVCHLGSASASSTHQVISCPGDALTTECAIMGDGATVWLGTAFQCKDSSNEILLLHRLFGESYSYIHTCNNGAALGVVNDSYISQLNVTVSLELNNTTVVCLHDTGKIVTVIRWIQIIVLATGKQECHTTNV